MNSEENGLNSLIPGVDYSRMIRIFAVQHSSFDIFSILTELIHIFSASAEPIFVDDSFEPLQIHTRMLHLFVATQNGCVGWNATALDNRK